MAKRVSEDEAQDFKRLYVEGLSQDEIAIKTGRDKKTVRENLKRLGVEMRPTGTQPGSTKIARRDRVRHGLTGHEHYPTWLAMVRRCGEPTESDFKHYGGRGILVFAPWRNDPRKYIDYIESVLGPKPGPDYSIDRINNDGNYEPGNLKWADKSRQAKNRRRRA